MSGGAVSPYAGYGRIVEGERLVGRSDMVADVTSRAINCNGSVALVGLPRIGKSSVAKAVFEHCDVEHIVRIWLDVGTFGGEVDLFRAVHNELEFADSANPGAASRGDSPYEIFREVARWCQRIRRSARHIVLVLDEFDSIRNHQGADATIRRLRELIYDTSKYGVSALMTTRRPLWWIERTNPDMSTLTGACETIYVRPLDSAGAERIYLRGGERVTSTVASDELWKVAGGHPYLTEMLLDQVWKGPTLQESLSEHRPEIDAYYEQVAEILELDGRINASDVLQPDRIIDLSHLRALGVLRGKHDAVWSSDFSDFVRRRERRDAGSKPAWSTDL